MTPEELDDFLDRTRAESAATVVSADFTDRVMRAVRTPAVATRGFDLFASSVASGALIGAALMLSLSGDEGLRLAATVLALIGLIWVWFDDPFSREMKVRLAPW
jgi:hypothetical protein